MSYMGKSKQEGKKKKRREEPEEPQELQEPQEPKGPKGSQEPQEPVGSQDPQDPEETPKPSSKKSVFSRMKGKLGNVGIKVHGAEEARAKLDELEQQDREDDAQMARAEDADERFNRELDELTEENANSKRFNLGNPSPILQSAGIADKPMILYGNKIIKKAKKHGFSIQDLKGLPNAIQNPIAIFAGTDAGSHAILTELKIGDQNVLVALSVGKNNMVEFNIVRSVYNKESKGKLIGLTMESFFMRTKKKPSIICLLPLPLRTSQTAKSFLMQQT